MTQTTLTTLAGVVGTYIEQEFFGFQQPDLVLYNDAKKFPQARGVGNVARFPVMRPLANVKKTNETGTGNTAEGSNPTPVAMTVDYTEVTMSKLDNAVSVNYEAWQTAIRPTSDQVARELRKNWNESLEYNIQSVMSTKFNSSRIDLSPSNQCGGTFTTGSATVPADTGLSTLFPTDDLLNGSLLVITGGPGAGQVALITDYATSGGIMTATFKVAPTTASTYKVIRTTGIDNSLPFNTNAFYTALAGLACYKAPKYGSGTMFRCAVDPMNWQDLMKDEVFQKTGMYRDSSKLEKGRVGWWIGCEVGVTSNGWTEAAGTIGTYSSTGDVHCVPFYGPGAFGCVSPKEGGEGVGNVEFFNIMTPDSNNITLAFTTHSYRGYFASVVPFGLFGYMIRCGSAFDIPGEVMASNIA